MSLRAHIRAAIGLVVVSVPASALADRSILVDADGVPFAATELVDAIRVRVPLDGPALHVRVTAIAGGVHVAADGGERDVALGGRHGADAARLVALAASDLLTSEAAIDDPPAQPTPPAASMPAATLVATPVATPAATRPTPPAVRPTPREQPAPVAMPSTTSLAASFTPSSPSTTSFAFLAGICAWDNAIASLTAELAFRPHDWVFAVDLGGGTSMGGPIQLVETELRIAAGRRLGPLELRLDAIAAPLIVTTGAGDFTALIGAGASLRWRGSIGEARIVLAAGVDAFANSTEYRTAGMDALTTPQLAPWLRAGVEVPL